ncbi:hypothetical protein ACWCO3_30195, partial [Micromonospora sp. NPDC002411]
MNILLWHVHGSWTTSFVHGGHRYLIPTTPDRGPYGLGRARTYPWPDSAVEVTPEDLPGTDVDLVILQRPEEIDRAQEWLRRRPGRDVPAIYVEHNTPKGDVPNTRHPMADRDADPTAPGERSLPGYAVRHRGVVRGVERGQRE